MEENGRVISRKEAKETGLIHYYTGIPCVYGHVTKRLVVNYACCECTKIRVAKYQKAHPEVIKERDERTKRKNGRWYRFFYGQDPVKRTLDAANRRAIKLNATPSWADKGKIQAVYAAARETGSHVDHIIPLKHPLICGLHVDYNLQLLPPLINLQKHNYFGVS